MPDPTALNMIVAIEAHRRTSVDPHLVDLCADLARVVHALDEKVDAATKPVALDRLAATPMRTAEEQRAIDVVRAENTALTAQAEAERLARLAADRRTEAAIFQAASAERSASQMDADRDALRAEVKATRADYDRAEVKASELTTSLITITRERNTLTAQVAQLRTDVIDIGASRAAAIARSEAATAQVAALEARCKAWQVATQCMTPASFSEEVAGIRSVLGAGMCDGVLTAAARVVKERDAALATRPGVDRAAIESAYRAGWMGHEGHVRGPTTPSACKTACAAYLASLPAAPAPVVLTVERLAEAIKAKDDDGAPLSEFIGEAREIHGHLTASGPVAIPSAVAPGATDEDAAKAMIDTLHHAQDGVAWGGLSSADQTHAVATIRAIRPLLAPPVARTVTVEQVVEQAEREYERVEDDSMIGSFTAVLVAHIGSTIIASPAPSDPGKGEPPTRLDDYETLKAAGIDSDHMTRGEMRAAAAKAPTKGRGEVGVPAPRMATSGAMLHFRREDDADGNVSVTVARLSTPAQPEAAGEVDREGLAEALFSAYWKNNCYGDDGSTTPEERGEWRRVADAALARLKPGAGASGPVWSESPDATGALFAVMGPLTLRASSTWWTVWMTTGGSMGCGKAPDLVTAKRAAVDLALAINGSTLARPGAVDVEALKVARGYVATAAPGTKDRRALDEIDRLITAAPSTPTPAPLTPPNTLHVYVGDGDETCRACGIEDDKADHVDLDAYAVGLAPRPSCSGCGSQTGPWSCRECADGGERGRAATELRDAVVVAACNHEQGSRMRPGAPWPVHALHLAVRAYNAHLTATPRATEAGRFVVVKADEVNGRPALGYHYEEYARRGAAACNNGTEKFHAEDLTGSSYQFAVVRDTAPQAKPGPVEMEPASYVFVDIGGAMIVRGRDELARVFLRSAGKPEVYELGREVKVTVRQPAATVEIEVKS